MQINPDFILVASIPVLAFAACAVAWRQGRKKTMGIIAMVAAAIMVFSCPAISQEPAQPAANHVAPEPAAIFSAAILAIVTMAGIWNWISSRRRKREDEKVRQRHEESRKRYIRPLDRSQMLATPEQSPSWKKHVGTFDTRYATFVAFDVDGTRLVGFCTEHNVAALAVAGFFHSPLWIPVSEFATPMRLPEGENLHLLPYGVTHGTLEEQRWIHLFLQYSKERKPKGELFDRYTIPDGPLSLKPHDAVLVVAA